MRAFPCGLSANKGVRMDSERGRRIYEDLGVNPVINAMGSQTVLGGSRLSPTVLRAMQDANRYFVDMKELLKRSGEVIAGMLGAEAALVTPGCASVLALGSAACMTGNDPARMERLPDTTGMPNEFLIQSRQRYKYERCVTVYGGKLVEVGDENGTTAAQLREAMSGRTAGLLYVAPGGGAGVVPLEDALAIARDRGVAVIVDAASQVFPLDVMCRYPRMGADVVGYGAKYFGACNSTGIMCGRKDLVDAAFVQGFIGFETEERRTVGRPLKVDRQEVIAVTAALKEWFEMDHEARFADHRRKAVQLFRSLNGVPNIQVEHVTEKRGLGSGLLIRFDGKALGKSLSQVLAELKEGRPSVVLGNSADALHVSVPTLTDEDLEVVGDRLREVLGAP